MGVRHGSGGYRESRTERVTVTSNPTTSISIICPTPDKIVTQSNGKCTVNVVVKTEGCIGAQVYDGGTWKSMLPFEQYYKYSYTTTQTGQHTIRVRGKTESGTATAEKTRTLNIQQQISVNANLLTTAINQAPNGHMSIASFTSVLTGSGLTAVEAEAILAAASVAGIIVLSAVGLGYIIYLCVTDDFVAPIDADGNPLVAEPSLGDLADYHEFCEALSISVTVDGRRIITDDGQVFNCDVLAEEMVTEMTQRKIRYLPAVLEDGFVWVAPQEIPVPIALAILMLNLEEAGVFALTKNDSFNLCRKLGATRGPETSSIGEGYCTHYHALSRINAHCWFIG